MCIERETKQTGMPEMDAAGFWWKSVDQDRRETVL